MLPLLLFASLQAHVFDLQGNVVDPFHSNARASVLIFVRTDCPISNRYAPEIQRLEGRFSAQGVNFWLVYPDPSENNESVRKHLAEYHYDIAAVRDPRHELVQAARVHVTPEAAVFLPGRKLVYHGRIDDRYTDFGKARSTATTHDLEAALEAAIAGKAVPNPTTHGVGCYLTDLR